MRTIIVSKCGNEDYTTVSEAIASIALENKEPVVIHIKPGTYYEKIEILPSFITLEGESAESTIISYDDYAKKIFPSGEVYRTFHSYTMFVGGSNITIKEMTIENTAGIGAKVGQAVALYVEGDQIVVENTRLLGNQDTLFTGPLPHKPVEGNDFGGPMEGKERKVGRQRYKKCYIEGDIDFIFGSAVATFEECELFSKDLGKEINGYVTAASTYKEQEEGYVFLRCRFTSNAKKGSVYLGRPWRNYAKTVLIQCELGAHIHPEGWHDWNKVDARDTVFYGEYESFGEGANKNNRVSWAHELKKEQVEKYIR